MTDEAFINRILEGGEKARKKVLEVFGDINKHQFNWKPSRSQWSMAQCLEHLVICDSAYFKVLQKITENKYKMSFWEKNSPFTAQCGKLLKDQLQEDGSKKMKTSRKLQPEFEDKSLEYIEEYQKNLEVFLQYVAKSAVVDLDKIIITSPVIYLVTYSLRDAFQFLIQHEHRHINQAIRVKSHSDFPKS